MKKRGAEKDREKEAKKPKTETEVCVRYVAVASPSKLPQCKAGELLAFNNDQIDAMRSKTAIKGVIAVVDITKIDGLIARVQNLEDVNTKHDQEIKTLKQSIKNLTTRMYALDKKASKYDRIREIALEDDVAEGEDEEVDE